MNGQRVDGDGKLVLCHGAVAKALNEDECDDGLMVDEARIN